MRVSEKMLLKSSTRAKLLLSSALVIGSLAVHSGAIADTATAASADSGAQLQEIVVTAERHETKL